VPVMLDLGVGAERLFLYTARRDCRFFGCGRGISGSGTVSELVILFGVMSWVDFSAC
jgi:hypothetical protein